jgi:hypothetical protein
MSGGGGKGGSTTVTQAVQIPTWLKPFVENAAGIGSGALSGLTDLLQPGGSGTPGASFVTPDQLEALAQARAVAQGGGGFIPTAQNVLMSAAQGQGLGDFIDPSALAALQRTAGGDFLFGGSGFNKAVDAAVRAAAPGILSTFGSAGPGGATGGLAQAAIGKAGVDAFAQQFAQERANQLNASQVLSSLGVGERTNQLNVAQALPGLGLIPSDILAQIGAQQAGFNQQPIQSLLQLLGAAQGVPAAFSPLLGRAASESGAGGLSFAGGLSGGLGGALTGAQIGSIVPGIGTGLGAGIGGGLGLLGGLFS